MTKKRKGFDGSLSTVQDILKKLQYSIEDLIRSKGRSKANCLKSKASFLKSKANCLQSKTHCLRYSIVVLLGELVQGHDCAS